ncbi:HNH endonuclease [Pseudomonas sp. 43NM1]|uniref:HNH endonuclease n=1 Tax=Pseudomonas sp. 43NM1 TaxID=1904755 RepID=UPI000C332458|nr:HNH endonuclease [Pseudomonas sp. 43NM1]
MARLTSIKSTLKPVEGRKLSTVAEGAGGDGWGSGRGGRPWRRRRATILLRDHYTCRVCGLITDQLEVDHIVNLAQGGSDDDDNLQAICIPCHKVKTAREATAHR